MKGKRVGCAWRGWVMLGVGLWMGCSLDASIINDATITILEDEAILEGPPDENCDSVEVVYDLQGSRLKIKETPMQMGDTLATIGPGRLVLRFSADTEGNIVEGPVVISSYDLFYRFRVVDIDTNMATEARADECGVAEGYYSDQKIVWDSPVRGYHVQGTITCHNRIPGACEFVGLRKGVPDKRDSTRDQLMNSFTFDSGMGFTMPWVQLYENESTGEAHLSLAGREVRRGRCRVGPVCEGEPEPELE
ncbi:MAG: hypothetical protein VX699_01450 [Myxococcota bacterium]|nr:hypothetical protein [Myxococcota bacterium]